MALKIGRMGRLVWPKPKFLDPWESNHLSKAALKISLNFLIFITTSGTLILAHCVKIIDLDPLHISSHLLKEVREGENWKSFKENELINFKLNYFITPNCPTGLGPDITKILKQSRYSRQAYNKLNGKIIL